MKTLYAVVVLAACGSRTPGMIDSGTQFPATIAISGYATLHGSNPSQSPADGVVQVGAYRISDGGLVAQANVVSGQFSLTVPTASAYSNVYLQAASEPYVATYYNFPSALVGDYSGATIDLFTPAAYAKLYSDAKLAQTAGTGVVEADARSFDGFPETGATLVIDSTAGGVVVYDGATGEPDPTASSTRADGIGYVLNAVPGNLTLTGYADYGYNASRQFQVVPGAVAMVFVDAPPGGD